MAAHSESKVGNIVMQSWVLSTAILGCGMFAYGQGAPPRVPNPFTVHSAAEIAEHSQRLLAKARSAPDGFAAESWQKFGNSYMMLAARVTQGAAEVHVHTGDYFVVLQGHATELAGGTLVSSKETAAGELRGPSISGGERQTLSPGDIVHISANTPHQTLMSGEPFVYFIIKVQE